MSVILRPHVPPFAGTRAAPLDTSAPWEPADSGAAAFTPAPGAAWWLRGDNVTLNGGTVASWLDISGNGRHWTQVSAPLQPTWVASAIAGKPGLSFSAAAGQYLAGPDMSALTEGECFYALQLNADPPPTTTKSGMDRFGTGASSVIPFSSDDIIYDGFGTSVRKATVVPRSSMAVPTIYSRYSAPNDWANYQDGVLLWSTVTNTVAFSPTPLIGGNPTGPNYFDGVMCEAICYARKLSSADRAKTIAYLKARYGIA